MSLASYLSRHLSAFDRERGAQRKLRHARSRVAAFSPPHKLHLGCGSVRLNDWINIDYSQSELDLDLSFPLPFAGASCTHIYHEHVMEHLPRAVADSLMRDCRRVLLPDGVMRIA